MMGRFILLFHIFALSACTVEGWRIPYDLTEKHVFESVEKTVQRELLSRRRQQQIETDHTTYLHGTSTWRSTKVADILVEIKEEEGMRRLHLKHVARETVGSDVFRAFQAPRKAVAPERTLRPEPLLSYIAHDLYVTQGVFFPDLKVQSEMLPWVPVARKGKREDRGEAYLRLKKDHPEAFEWSSVPKSEGSIAAAMVDSEDPHRLGVVTYRAEPRNTPQLHLSKDRGKSWKTISFPSGSLTLRPTIEAHLLGREVWILHRESLLKYDLEEGVWKNREHRLKGSRMMRDGTLLFWTKEDLFRDDLRPIDTESLKGLMGHANLHIQDARIEEGAIQVLLSDGTWYAK